MKKWFFALAITFTGYSTLANDSIYGGYNPAGRCQNPAGLENPFGVRKMICRELLTGNFYYFPAVGATKEVKVIDKGQVDQINQINQEGGHFLTDADLASLIDPHFLNSHARCLTDFTIGEYRAACADLVDRGIWSF